MKIFAKIILVIFLVVITAIVTLETLFEIQYAIRTNTFNITNVFFIIVKVIVIYFISSAVVDATNKH